MPWTWFISLEAHFYFATCLILLISQIHPKYAGSICSTLFISSITSSIILEMDPFPHRSRTPEHELIEINLIFEKVLERISPYLLGNCMGYVLYKTKGKFDMNVFIVVLGLFLFLKLFLLSYRFILGWIACILMGAGFIFGYDIILFEKNQWIRATILTLSHTIWSMILFWIILASISRYNLGLRAVMKLKVFQICGKLSNCTFFIGPLVIKVFFLCSESASNTSIGYMV